METLHENGNGVAENGHSLMRHSPYQSGFKLSLQWLDLRVFYIRISKCELDDLTAEYLTVNYVPLKRDTLLEVNGARTGIYSDGVSTILRRDRFDKKSEEVTFVSTDSISMTGSVKYEVFDRDVLVLSGSLDLCDSNGFLSESENHGQSWNINCEMDVFAGSSLQKGNQHTATDLASPVIEVYIAGCFSGKPIILTRALQLGHRRKQLRPGMLESIPEYEATESQYHASSSHAMQVTDHAKPKQEYDEYNNLYSRMEYIEGEDGELSWFNAGVRVGVGIGLSICVGIGIGAGLLARTYQGTTRNFRRRLL
ncbi:uncharacterized protein At1g01500-like [Nicotiana sylvestris]|uniref:Uncharacterized protein At1g01500-like n=1 Tax=Nicotiana sylvestris TaxID=4096 RepID=A0A1U7VRI9_NICSY|nr:PREDICTED: uncharacterized protein At1g01500-like [Nicotiana sylvestris]XP_009769013.1 PREDICTED: uncharacterized protein At1g01500-like [Nicotiana sylvestris]XP_009769014.1 PREDICTED: uncharacterized protein At1g01500-like [Nicotiana sylvestris]XP_009769015.1 PREDICTED: uncharacterized protein At1g01500-like [Nicotiana sylvestris]